MNTEITHTAGLLHIYAGTIRSDADGDLLPLNEGNVHRLAAAWNACDGIDTATIENMRAGTVGQQVVYVASSDTDDGQGVSLFRTKQAAIDAVIEWCIERLNDTAYGVSTDAEEARGMGEEAARAHLEKEGWLRFGSGDCYYSVSEETVNGVLPVPAALSHVDPARAAMESAVKAFDMLANECTHANPDLTRVFNRVIEETGCTLALSQALAGGPDPWHLFYIEASDADGVHAFIVSAQSGSQSKAQELAEAAVIDYPALGTKEHPGSIGHVGTLGLTDSDVFESVGLLAD
jgi:hypothetical protein